MKYLTLKNPFFFSYHAYHTHEKRTPAWKCPHKCTQTHTNLTTQKNFFNFFKIFCHFSCFMSIRAQLNLQNLHENTAFALYIFKLANCSKFCELSIYSMFSRINRTWHGSKTSDCFSPSW